MTELWITAAIVWGVVWGAFTAVVADSKGHPGGRWFIAGFLFSLPAMLAAIGIMAADRVPEPERRSRPAEWEEGQPAPRPTALRKARDPNSTFSGILLLMVIVVLGVVFFFWVGR